MSHSQLRMSPFLHISIGSTESKNQETAKSMFGSLQIPSVIHGAKNIVGWNSPIKRGNQSLKTFVADLAVNAGNFSFVRHESFAPFGYRRFEYSGIDFVVTFFV